MSYHYKYTNWKQFTTCEFVTTTIGSLWVTTTNIQIESNSQHLSILILSLVTCELPLQIYKLKAIHNILLNWLGSIVLVSYHYKYTNWKQFTTIKITHHNNKYLWVTTTNIQIESNSQHTFNTTKDTATCELPLQIYKLKAIHNDFDKNGDKLHLVSYHYKYTNWKQFTTNRWLLCKRTSLWVTTTNIQIESNSQHILTFIFGKGSCELPLQIYKLKAIHNNLHFF